MINKDGVTDLQPCNCQKRQEEEEEEEKKEEEQYIAFATNIPIRSATEP